tara:strand:- start:2469 stop:2906 length:438 start_codon:yes stop_codon:yes gene_type:complete
MINPSKIRIISVGKITKSFITLGIKYYKRRLNGIQIIELKDSNKDKEAKIILQTFLKNEIKIILSEEGLIFNSVKLTDTLLKYSPQKISFVIGGPDGISNKIKDSADLILSLSPLTFPHEIVQLLLLEQIYRCQAISARHPYHRS